MSNAFEKSITIVPLLFPFFNTESNVPIILEKTCLVIWFLGKPAKEFDILGFVNEIVQVNSRTATRTDIGLTRLSALKQVEKFQGRTALSFDLIDALKIN